MDPISASLFIIALEIILTVIKKSSNMKGLDNFDHNYSYTIDLYDTVLFLNDENYIKEPIKTF